MTVIEGAHLSKHPEFERGLAHRRKPGRVGWVNTEHERGRVENRLKRRHASSQTQGESTSHSLQGPRVPCSWHILQSLNQRV